MGDGRPLYCQREGEKRQTRKRGQARDDDDRGIFGVYKPKIHEELKFIHDVSMCCQSAGFEYTTF